MRISAAVQAAILTNRKRDDSNLNAKICANNEDSCNDIYLFIYLFVI